MQHRLDQVIVTAALLVASTLVVPDRADARVPRKQTEYVVMRDGVELATDVYRKRISAPLPTVLLRTPYNKNTDNGVSSYAEKGYAVVIQDTRGRYASGGEYDIFLSDGWGDNQDGYDTVEWIASQSWSDGKVCVVGSSARGISAYLAAGAAPPHLTCVFAEVGTADLYPVAYEAGAYRQELVNGWLAGLGESQAIDLVQDNYLYSDMWAPVHIPDRYDLVDVPIFHLAGWWDPFREGGLSMFSNVNIYGGDQARGNQWLVIGPWTHGNNESTSQGEVVYPPNSTYDDDPVEEQWLEYWLKGVDNGIIDTPTVQYYLMGATGEQGAPGNEWRTTTTWPPPATATAFYFAGSGRLTTTATTSDPMTFSYEPSDPVPTRGGNNLTIQSGPFDQSQIEGRSDVLTFTSDVLLSPLEVTGQVSAVLFVSSSVVDTDFTVKLTDVYPDGRSMLVLDGVIRMRSREGVDQEVFMTPGEVYEVEIDLGSTATAFNVGHQLRVDISSSNSTRYQANPDVEDMFSTTDAIPATQTVYADATRPSRILLPVVR